MRVLLLTIVLAGCAHVPIRSEATPAESAIAVSVHYKATCETLRSAKAVGVGFWVNRSTVATVRHYREHEEPPTPFPDFAVVGPDGCRDGQIAAEHDDGYDVIFIHVRGRRMEGFIPPISKATPAPGWLLTAVVPGTLRFAGDAARQDFRRVAMEVADYPEVLPQSSDPPFFHARPALNVGESGSPALNDAGEIAGMFLLRFKTAPLEPYQGSFLSARVIGYLLDACGPCEE